MVRVEEPLFDCWAEPADDDYPNQKRHEEIEVLGPLNDAVMRDGLADHSWRILRGRNWQVNESRGVGDPRKLLL